MIQSSKSYFLHLFFPTRCLNCQEELIGEETFLCPFCVTELSSIYYGPFNLALLGTIPCYGLYHYEEGKVAQKLIHQLKYGHKKHIGLELGYILAACAQSTKYPQLLLPVPISSKKRMTRGYNQSEWIGKGLQAKTGILLNTKCLKRVRNTHSQTQLGKKERQSNVEGAFVLAEPLPPGINHVGVVDDVITTGATLSQIVKCLTNQYPQLQITIFAAAIAKQ